MRRVNPALTLTLMAAALLVAGCSGGSLNLPGFSQPEAPPPPQVAAPVPTLPPAFPPQDIVGRWGLAAYHNVADRERTEAAARGQCKQPYVIGAGQSGGVVMHLADQATPQELRLKGSPAGKNYIGPAGPTPGEQDREIVSFDGRVLITRFVDPEVSGRYGTSVYVRCGAETVAGSKKGAAKKN